MSIPQTKTYTHTKETHSLRTIQIDIKYTVHFFFSKMDIIIVSLLNFVSLKFNQHILIDTFMVEKKTVVKKKKSNPS